MTSPLVEPEPPKSCAIIDAKVAEMLVLGHINMLWMKDQDEGCCPVCCGPCWALKWLLDSGQLEDIIADAGPGHFWWKGAVDREWLAQAWRMSECHEVVVAELMIEEGTPHA